MSITLATNRRPCNRCTLVWAPIVADSRYYPCGACSLHDRSGVFLRPEELVTIENERREPATNRGSPCYATKTGLALRQSFFSVGHHLHLKQAIKLLDELHKIKQKEIVPNGTGI